MTIWLLQEEYDGIPDAPEPFLSADAIDQECHKRICGYYELDAATTSISFAFDYMSEHWDSWGIRTFIIEIPKDVRDFSNYLLEKYGKEDK